MRVPTYLELNDLSIAATSIVPADWIDFMGHMNVMWYTHLFSRSVLGFFQTIGLTQEYFQANDTGSFVLEQHILYIAEVREGETVSVRTRALGRSDKRLHFQTFLVKEDSQTLAATSEIITVHIDMSRRRSSPLPSQVNDAFDAVLEQHSRLAWTSPANGFTHA